EPHYDPQDDPHDRPPSTSPLLGVPVFSSSRFRLLFHRQAPSPLFPLPFQFLRLLPRRASQQREAGDTRSAFRARKPRQHLLYPLAVEHRVGFPHQSPFPRKPQSQPSPVFSVALAHHVPAAHQLLHLQ